MSNVIYISRLFNMDVNNLYTDIAFLTVEQTSESDAINRKYLEVKSEDERFFINPPSSITREFKPGLKINDWDEPIFFNKPFNYLYKIGSDDPKTEQIIELIFRS